MEAPTKNKANDAWMQQVQKQQARRGHKRRAHTMIARGDPQFFAPIGGVTSGRKSPRTTCPVSYTDVPDHLVYATLPGDCLDDKPLASAPPATSTAAPAPPAISTAADAVGVLATIAGALEDPMASSHH